MLLDAPPPPRYGEQDNVLEAGLVYIAIRYFVKKANVTN